ncbi:MAG: glutamate synthase [Candidatus Moranbacteria bacterium RIFOXYA1_FULL_44_8]|nr:MAG: glutamate synthase [Candidatus Moranbacteria bacterium RIFOXYA1_FULL_44_8]
MPVKNSKENRQKCLCPNCPSYPHDCNGEVLYCSEEIGHSQCDVSAKSCLCPGCLVWSENNLKEIYYCTRDTIELASGRGGSAFGGKVVMRKKKSNESDEFYQTVVDIKTLAETGERIVRPMGSLKKPGCNFSLGNLHFMPAQVAKIPLDREEKVNTEVTIGPKAKKPMKVSSPIMISGMSFGSTSKNVHLVISQAAKYLKIGFNSGEGGILDEEYESKEFLIGQYATGRFGLNEDVIKKVAAVEIRFGQGAYPGKGSYLPAKKMTEEVANLRGLKTGETAYSPAHHHDMETLEEIKNKVAWLREMTGGVPVGAKIGCGNVEKDVKVLAEAGVDFIAIDGFGGGTGATDAFVKDNVGIPVFAAVPRAYKMLKDLGVKNNISLIAAGGLRISADFAKCLALGADAVYIGTAALIAINCQQYRVCHTGLCPTGVTTHRPELTSQLKIKEGVRKLSNFVKISTEEIAEIARILGKNDVNELSSEDLVAMNKDLGEICGVKWLGEK